jgi:hypothetical protein
MENRPAQELRRLDGSEDDRLARDLVALGLLDPTRPSAAERLTAMLGDELVAAIHAELERASSNPAPLRGCPRRVA